MRFIIAIVLGTLMFQGSPLQLPRPRDEDVKTRWNFESTTLEHTFEHTRGKRSIPSTSGGTEQQSNIRIVRIFHKYEYFLQVSNDGKVKGTQDTVNGNVLFRMETYGTSLVRLYNIATKRYIAITKKGVVISERGPDLTSATATIKLREHEPIGCVESIRLTNHMCNRSTKPKIPYSTNTVLEVVTSDSH